MTDSRPRRADALRNRAALLAAAEAEFAERGLEASVADIARRAGTGKGTVFRHFPTKDDLLAAVVLDRVNELALLADRLLASADAGEALWEFLEAAAGRQQRLDFSFLRGAGELNDRLAAARGDLFASVSELVARAQAAGAVRPDVTGADVILLMTAPAYVAGFAPPSAPSASGVALGDAGGLWRRYLGIIIDGLRPEGAHRLPGAD